MEQKVIVSEQLTEEIQKAIEEMKPDRIFLLTDNCTHKLCRPLLESLFNIYKIKEITIPATDRYKGIESLSSVWEKLSCGGGTRRSLLLNLGGGMVTDLGGFAAATFKRGIPCINLPTTLLAMVDASVGGKTGINFNGLKNEIGSFYPAERVVIHSSFLRTLDRENLLSGFAEMLKHGLISNKTHLNELLRFDWERADFSSMQPLIGESIRIKQQIVKEDPQEKGVRKALNLGHTVGHAFESLALKEGCPVLHGYAVAWGLVCELYLSTLLTGFPSELLRTIAYYIKQEYGMFYFTCKEYEQLYELMTHDKKNSNGIINFTLLAEIGDIRLNQTAEKSVIFEMFDFYRECMGV